ncbi:MAG: phosphonate metabolism protein PhnP [Candidatus Muproteobacteria bacterium RBG_16_64_11]|uniref:Phosphonate metabolism protein PhnP n=1 Tax=Candidatus Muproteobacteria bacterium RBG_16_64_11 TaxID=1817758 RepID=A0A1F6TFW2_9PROT|nr:MAG: phosphonate metabolism protein PhnP [Candidatus Muproteobacteria bacterium RBG_16_64_11]
MRLTLLGTGASGGVPLYGCDCPACTRARVHSKYRRAPCSALVESGDRRLLIDAGLMDLAERFPAGSLHGVLLTHYHPDHVQGLFHLRWGVGAPIDVYGPPDAEGCADLYKNAGLLRFHRLTKFAPLQLGDLVITPVPLIHSKPTLGYCLEHNGQRVAYLTDTCGLPPATREFLAGWRPQAVVLDCTHPPRAEPARNHNDLSQALAISAEIGDPHLVLTHVSHAFDTWLMQHPETLPASACLARDGATVRLPNA